VNAARFRSRQTHEWNLRDRLSPPRARGRRSLCARKCSSSKPLPKTWPSVAPESRRNVKQSIGKASWERQCPDRTLQGANPIPALLRPRLMDDAVPQCAEDLVWLEEREAFGIKRLLRSSSPRKRGSSGACQKTMDSRFRGNDDQGTASARFSSSPRKGRRHSHDSRRPRERDGIRTILIVPAKGPASARFSSSPERDGIRKILVVPARAGIQWRFYLCRDAARRQRFDPFQA
jgi:hypothetical protein